VAQSVRSLDLTTHTSLSPIRRGVVNYKKGTLVPQPHVIKFASCLPMVGTPASSSTKTDCHDIAEILLKVALKHQKSKSITCVFFKYVPHKFFKTLKNMCFVFFSVFGKCIENLRARMSLQLVNSEEKLKKLVAKPSFLRCQIFNEDLVGVHNQQINLTLQVFSIKLFQIIKHRGREYEVSRKIWLLFVIEKLSQYEVSRKLWLLFVIEKLSLTNR